MGSVVSYKRDSLTFQQACKLYVAGQYAFNVPPVQGHWDDYDWMKHIFGAGVSNWPGRKDGLRCLEIINREYKRLLQADQSN